MRTLSKAKLLRAKAMDLLARREHGVTELARKLSAKIEADTDEIAAVIDVLVREDLVSDARFCESYINSEINRGYGPIKIRHALSARGINSEVISTALAEVEQDWFALAQFVRNKKFGADIPSDFTARSKQMRFLQYRGFEPDHIQAVFD